MFFTWNISKNHRREREREERKYRTNCTWQNLKPDLLNYGVKGAGRGQSLKGTPGPDTDIDIGRKSTQESKR